MAARRPLRIGPAQLAHIRQNVPLFSRSQARDRAVEIKTRRSYPTCRSRKSEASPVHQQVTRPPGKGSPSRFTRLDLPPSCLLNLSRGQHARDPRDALVRPIRFDGPTSREGDDRNHRLRRRRSSQARPYLRIVTSGEPDTLLPLYALRWGGIVLSHGGPRFVSAWRADRARLPPMSCYPARAGALALPAGG